MCILCLLQAQAPISLSSSQLPTPTLAILAAPACWVLWSLQGCILPLGLLPPLRAGSLAHLPGCSWLDHLQMPGITRSLEQEACGEDAPWHGHGCSELGAPGLGGCSLSRVVCFWGLTGEKCRCSGWPGLSQSPARASTTFLLPDCLYPRIAVGPIVCKVL